MASKQMYPIKGAKVYIGGAAIDDKATAFSSSDFSSVTWTQIKGLTQMGRYGDASASVTSDQIDSERTKKAKGTRNAGTAEFSFDVIADDTGQIAVYAAAQSDLNWPIKIEWDDAPSTGSSPTPTIDYFIGLVMSATENGGPANSPRQLGMSVEINSNIVRVALATGD